MAHIYHQALFCCRVNRLRAADVHDFIEETLCLCEGMNKTNVFSSCLR